MRAFDPPLTELGLSQAASQADSLAAVGLKAIYASPLARTRQTAAFVSERCGLPVTYSDALWEVDVGELDGRIVDEASLSTFREVVDEWEEGRWDASLAGGESFAYVRDRFYGFIDHCIDGAEGPLLIVGHGVLFMVVLWAFCTNPRPRLSDNYMGCGHISVLSWEGGRGRLLRYNLPPGAQPPRTPDALGSAGAEAG